MYFKKTGRRIKELIPHRKANTRGGTGDYINGQYYLNEKGFANIPGRLSWLWQNPPEPSLPRRHESVATVASCQLCPTTENAYSSANSLCSCHCCTNPELIEDSLCGVAPESKTFGVLYSPQPSPSITGGAKTWHLIFEEALSQSQAPIGAGICTAIPSTNEEFILSSFHLPPTPDLKASNGNITLTQKTKDPEMCDSSEEVDKLIRETDEAFKAVGTALEDAKAATQGWYDKPEAPSIKQSPKVTRSPSKKPVRHTFPNTKGTPSSSILGSKVNRRKSVKKRKPNILSRALRRAPPPPAKSSSRWKLTEVTTNVVEVFSGKMFRTEVDEMISPGRMQQLCKDIRHQNERSASLDSRGSAETFESSTPAEPFHVKDLTPRTDTTKSNRPPFPNPILPPPAISLGGRVSSPGEKAKTTTEEGFTNDGTSSEDMLFDDLQFPTPPQGHGQHRGSSSRFLPTIPEFKPLSLSPTPTLRKPSSCPLNRIQTQNSRYVTLPSTSFTLTSAPFRHGPIRFERETLLNLYHGQVLNTSNSGDDQLDWTAFQIAILGTMEDGWDADDEWTQDEENEEDEEGTLKWWEGFHFAGWGTMVTESDDGYEGETKFEHGRCGRDVGVNNIVESYYEQSEYSISSDSRSGYTDYSTIAGGLEVDNRPIADDKMTSTPTYSPRAMDSFLQANDLLLSPMRDFTVTDGTGKEAKSAISVMPMGFNLEHDLEDFLDWEGSHVQHPRWDKYEG